MTILQIIVTHWKVLTKIGSFLSLILAYWRRENIMKFFLKYKIKKKILQFMNNRREFYKEDTEINRIENNPFYNQLALRDYELYELFSDIKNRTIKDIRDVLEKLADKELIFRTYKQDENGILSKPTQYYYKLHENE